MLLRHSLLDTSGIAKNLKPNNPLRKPFQTRLLCLSMNDSGNRLLNLLTKVKENKCLH